MRENKYDIVVIGGGHAGIEAAYVAAKMGCKTALLTMSLHTMGKPSCNPSIGGTAKGHLVKEIDAIGGAMGLLADKSGIQFKTLNKSKGPAVWAGRCQSDRELYEQEALKIVEAEKNIDIVEDIVVDLIV